MMTGSFGVQRTHKRQTACIVSAAVLHVTVGGHRTQGLGTRTPRHLIVAMRANGYGT